MNGTKKPIAPDHDVSFWRGNALALVMVGLAVWPWWGIVSEVMAAVLFACAAGAWSLTRGRE